MSNTKTQTPNGPDYGELRRVLALAYEQAATGKGKERHANGRDFDKQPIMEYGRIVGPGGTAFQAQKKLGEAIATHLSVNHGAAVQELLGSIVYAAATVMLIEELRGTGDVPSTQTGVSFMEGSENLRAPLFEQQPTFTKEDIADALRASKFANIGKDAANKLADGVAEALGVEHRDPKAMPKDLQFAIEHKGMHEALRSVFVVLSNYTHLPMHNALIRDMLGKLAQYTMPDDLHAARDAIAERVKLQKGVRPAVNNLEPGDGH